MTLKHYYKHFIPILEKEIKKIIPSKGFPNLYDGMNYVFLTGGKRFRPILCLSVCKALGGDIKKALPLAVSIEIVHNSLLVHDDIKDEDEIRRNYPTVWKKYGIAHAIDIGDGLIFKAYECLLQSKQVLPYEKVVKLMEMFTNTIIEIIEGLNIELNLKERDNTTIEEYLEMAKRKTGALFGLALSGGAFIANADKETQTILMNYGKESGVAFQIRDDILNLTGDPKKYGKEIGGDIKEGKKTLIMIHCLLNCDKNEKTELLNILRKPRKNTTSEDVKFAIELVKKYNSIEFAQKFSENIIKKIRKSSEEINNTKLRKLLEDFFNLVIKREY